MKPIKRASKPKMGRRPLPPGQERVTRCLRLPARMDKKIVAVGKSKGQTPSKVIENGLILAGFGE